MPHMDRAVLVACLLGALGASEARAADNDTRLFFGPNGRTLVRGEGYVTADQLFLPYVQVGITDHVSMGAGTLALFSSDVTPPIWLTPKVKIFESDRTAVAAGVIDAIFSGDQFGLAYVVATSGPRDKAFTLGAGWTYLHHSGSVIQTPTSSARPGYSVQPGRQSGDPSHTEGAPVLIAGAEYRISRRVTVVSEDYLGSHGGTALVGIRVIDKHHPNLTANVGLMMPITSSIFIVAPVFNFTWHFGR